MVSDSLSRNSHCIIMDESPIDSAVNGLPRCAVSKTGSEKILGPTRFGSFSAPFWEFLLSPKTKGPKTEKKKMKPVVTPS